MENRPAKRYARPTISGTIGVALAFLGLGLDVPDAIVIPVAAVVVAGAPVWAGAIRLWPGTKRRFVDWLRRELAEAGPQPTHTVGTIVSPIAAAQGHTQEVQHREREQTAEQAARREEAEEREVHNDDLHTALRGAYREVDALNNASTGKARTTCRSRAVTPSPGTSRSPRQRAGQLPVVPDYCE